MSLLFIRKNSLRHLRAVTIYRNGAKGIYSMGGLFMNNTIDIWEQPNVELTKNQLAILNFAKTNLK